MGMKLHIGGVQSYAALTLAWLLAGHGHFPNTFYASDTPNSQRRTSLGCVMRLPLILIDRWPDLQRTFP